MTPNKKALPSRKISTEFRMMKKSPQWQAMSFKEKHEAIFNHKLELKAQLNKEYYAKHFGFSLRELQDDFITDAEIKALLETESVISAKVEQEMAMIYNGKPAKKRTASKAEGNMNHLYSRPRK